MISVLGFIELGFPPNPLGQTPAMGAGSREVALVEPRQGCYRHLLIQLGAICTLLVASLHVSAEPVHADDSFAFGQVGRHGPASVLCRDGTGSKDDVHQLSLSADLSPASGYRTQYVAFRFWIYDWDGQKWLDPVPSKWIFLTASLTDVRVGPDMTLNVMATYHYVFAEYAWWNGQQWSEAGLFTTTYKQGVYL